jgi:hypothetical protein
MSLAGKRLLSFFAFAGFSSIVGFIFFLVPLSIWALRSDPTGSGSGYFIAGLLFFSPIVVVPGAIIAGLLVLPLINRALKATTLSLSDYATFLFAIVLSAFIGIVATYAFAWIGALLLQNINIPSV